jgi:hypothetical protein
MAEEAAAQQAIAGRASIPSGGRCHLPASLAKKDPNVRKLILFLAILLFLCLGGCYATPHSNRSFDEIRSLVQGKTAAEIETLLGPPNSKQTSALGDERWIWWNYTFLGGQDYSPESRGKIVHLQIVFSNPDPTVTEKPPYSKWQIVDPMSVSYLLPQTGK